MPIVGLNQDTGTSDLMVKSSFRLRQILKDQGTQMVVRDHSSQIEFIVAKYLVAIKTKLPITNLEPDLHRSVGFQIVDAQSSYG